MLPKVVDLDAVELGRRLADVVGSAVDVINRNTNSPHKEARALVDILPASDYLDEMRAMFDAAGYFKRVTRAHAINALEEITEAGFGAGLPPEDVLFDAKKPVLAELASTYAVKCGWLPVELRSGAYVLIDNSRKAAA